MQFQGQFGTDWGRVLAFVSLALVPTIIFYLFAERQIVAGLTAGAVKGMMQDCRQSWAISRIAAVAVTDFFP